MDRSPNVACAWRHTGSISVARGQGVRSDSAEATATLNPTYEDYLHRQLLRISQAIDFRHGG